MLSPSELEKLREDIELLDIGGDHFSLEKVLAGQLSPMFFGSAMTNFGVRPFLDAFLEMAPPPSGRPASCGFIDPVLEKFTGFVFKIQANMDPSHRDRIAFLRVVSGHYVKDDGFPRAVNKDIRPAKPTQFMASERTAIEDAHLGTSSASSTLASASGTPSWRGVRRSTSSGATLSPEYCWSVRKIP